MKKFISVFTALLMALQCFPAIIAGAAGETEIADAAAFMEWIQGGAATDAVLTGNITLGDSKFTPVQEFSNTLDGGGHIISGLNIDEKSDGALFVNMTGTVKNLTVGGAVSAKNAAAVAVNNSGVIENVKNNAIIYGSAQAAGIAVNNSGSIASCINAGDITTSQNGTYIGGIAAQSSSENASGAALISGCVNFAQVGTPGGGTVSYAGGICAYIACDDQDIFCAENSANFGAVYGSCAGGIAGYVSGSAEKGIYSCRNIGTVTGSGKADVGGIAGSAEAKIADAANYGSISNGTTSDNFGTGGIAGALSASAENAVNYGSVNAVKYTGGIAGTAGSDILNAVNYGEISGTSYIGGIAGSLSAGEIADSSNRGEVHSREHHTGGITGYIPDWGEGKITRCYNAAVVSGGEGEISFNYTGGIVGYAQSTASVLEDVYSTVLAAAPGGALGAIAGSVKGTVTGAYSLDSGTRKNYGSQSGAAVTCDYYKLTSDSKYTSNADSALKIDADELLTALNTLDDTVGDRGVWVMGADNYPVLAADAEEKIDTAEKLTAALEGPETEINVSGVITLDSGVTVSGDKTITGGQIIFTDGCLNAEGNLTLSGTSIRAVGNSVVYSGTDTLTVSGYVDTNAPVRMESGTIDVSGGYIYNSGEAELDPSFTAAEGVQVIGAEKCRILEPDRYYYNYPEAFDMTTSLRATAAENNIPYDVNSSLINGIVYLFLPETADLSAVTFTEISGDNEAGAVHENVDFTDDVRDTAVVGGFEREVKAMKSTIPALYINIDEQYGTIEAMNTSPDHDVKCYGDAELVVPEALAAEKGWEGFKSVENDEKKNGTMEIKGRGNSTWVPDGSITKKPYQMKLEKKTDVLGMGKAKTWLLIKNDESIIRNKLALDLGHAMGMEYTGYGEFIDVYMNGEYLGNYLLTEKVETGETRVNISNLDDEYEANNNSIDGLDMTGGYLMESDNWGGDDLQVQGHGTTFSIKEPEDLAKTVTDDNEYSYIKHYLEGFLDAVFGDGSWDGEYYLSKIDIDSFMAYFWNQEFLRNGDCGRGSTYFYKDKDSIDPLLYAGPLWDNDRIFEKSGIPNNTQGWLIPTIDIAGSGEKTIYNQLIHRREFARLALDYYRDHNLAETFAGFSSKIDEYSAYLQSSAAMNAARWGLPAFDISRFKTILQERAKWVDENADTLLEYSKEDTNLLSGYIRNNQFNVSVSYAGMKNEEAQLITAAYKDGVLIDVNVTDVKNDGTEDIGEWTADIPADADEVSAMLLNSLSGGESLKPLASAVKIKIR